jgi:hypothetical protein
MLQFLELVWIDNSPGWNAAAGGHAGLSTGATITVGYRGSARYKKKIPLTSSWHAEVMKSAGGRDG